VHLARLEPRARVHAEVDRVVHAFEHPGVALLEAVDTWCPIPERPGHACGPEIAGLVDVAVARYEPVGPFGHPSLVAPRPGMAEIVWTMALLPPRRSLTMADMSRRVVFVVYPRVTALDLVGPHEVFAASGGYEIVVAAPDAGAVVTVRGPGIVADRSLASVRGSIDTLVVVGGEGAFAAARDPKLVRAVVRLARRSRRVASVCTGAFVLAAAGLLDGKRATTHWSSCERLTEGYPQIEVEGERIFVRDGNVWTSAGVTAGMDLALALVADDMGQDIARAVARQLVMYVQRPGGQAQFSVQLRAPRAARDPLRELQGWIGEHPAEDHGVERLATRVSMSPRHFARVFRADVGCTPAAYVEQVRVEVARRLLETTGFTIDEVAATAGFGTPETLRRAFARRVGASPTEYRDRFRSFQTA
jgi:transcriptional regulator GlxA family with amidase domain